MWISTAIVNEDMQLELAMEQMTNVKEFMESIWALGIETGGQRLPPYETTEQAVAAFAPGTIYQRIWNLESSAQAVTDFINNHPAKQLTVTYKQQEV
jgi:hypothetical protein